MFFVTMEPLTFHRTTVSISATERPLFGGAVSFTFTLKFEDVFLDLARDESLIFELLELKHDIEDNGSATWFLQALAREQGAKGNIVISFVEVTEQSAMFEAPELQFRNLPAVITTTTTQMWPITI